MGSNDFELKLLKTFVEQTTIEMEKIREFLQKKDWNSLCASAHKIKPSFHFIGGLEAETLLTSMEDITRHKTNLGKLPELVGTFLQACKKTIGDVKIEIEKYKR